jgi:hypothetical protein
MEMAVVGAPLFDDRAQLTTSPAHIRRLGPSPNCLTLSVLPEGFQLFFFGPEQISFLTERL